jgi:cell division protease FtsH
VGKTSDGYWSAEDNRRPMKNPPVATKTYSEEELIRRRTELFEEGSDFKETHRSDIVGIDNVLAEVDQVIHWLRNASEYQKYGSRLEPGVIFEGDPGTGKTLVSRYIATESDALFVNVRDFPHEGTLYRDSDIADLFKRARERYAETNCPVVLFWDEFENAAIERSEATPDQAVTVSQITAELDGIHGKNEGILLIGCTNYIYGIDAALRRSGRMGLQIEFHAPDREGKKLLLDHYLKQYELRGTLDINTLSYFFETRATAADIEEACVEAWRQAIYRKIENKAEKPSLVQDDLIEGFLKRLVGPPTSFVNMTLEDRAQIAVHECGHAIMAVVYDIPLRLITVQPGKKALGRTFTFEKNDHIDTIDEWVSHLRVGLGSISAEKEAGLPAGAGCTHDIEEVNKIGAQLVDELYAGKETKLMNPTAIAGVRHKSHDSRANPNISLSTVDKADRDIERLLEVSSLDADKTMANIGKENLWKIANIVNERVTLTGDEFKEAFASVLGTDDFASYRSTVDIVSDTPEEIQAL